MKKFLSAINTQYQNKRGMDVEIQVSEGCAVKASVYVDTTESIVLRVQVGDDRVLDVAVCAAAYVQAEVSYSDDLSYCYLKFGVFEVHIKLESEGVVFDVWEIDGADGECIDTGYLFDEDLEVA
ncbi:hypothetical protein [Neptuniibacter sp. QD37_11]|uniref:hypothetical protein n=1 Tax=Neptuniibacter sp. QD37_11 TaxID=3398209 RepID=UPI0039F61B8E